MLRCLFNFKDFRGGDYHNGDYHKGRSIDVRNKLKVIENIVNCEIMYIKK